MLVIQVIPLQFVPQVSRVHHLKRKHTVVAKTTSRSLQNNIGPCIVSKRVAAGHDIRVAVLGYDLVRYGRAEEAGDNLQALRPGHVGDIIRDVDADGLHSELFQGRQKDAVIASELDDHLGMKSVVKPLRIVGEGIHQRPNGARRKGVILEKDIGIDGLDDLYESTVAADVDRKRIGLLILDVVGRTQKDADRKSTRLNSRHTHISR